MKRILQFCLAAALGLGTVGLATGAPLDNDSVAQQRITRQVRRTEDPVGQQDRDIPVPAQQFRHRLLRPQPRLTHELGI